MSPPHDFDGCVYCELHKYDDWVHCQFQYSIAGDTYIQADDKTVHHGIHFKSFNLYPANDIEMIKKVMSYNPEVIGLTCFFYFDKPLAKGPETLDEALAAIEGNRFESECIENS